MLKYQLSNVESLRFDYPLEEGEIVFDVGGYKGGFTRAILAEQPKVEIFVFEPVEEYYRELENLFADRENVHLLNYGLGERSRSERIDIRGPASTVYDDPSGGGGEKVEIRDIEKVIDELGVGEIELMNINSEGGEYGTLKSLLDSGKIKSVNHLQVQFHDCVPDATSKRERIRERLRETHREEYCFYFAFEGWERIP